MSQYRIVRDDGQLDNIAGQAFSTYDAAYAVLERYYGDLCCSDGREYYREGSEYPAEVTPPAHPALRDAAAQPAGHGHHPRQAAEPQALHQAGGVAQPTLMPESPVTTGGW